MNYTNKQIKNITALTFNPSDWSGRGDVTATAIELDSSEVIVIFRGEQWMVAFESKSDREVDGGAYDGQVAYLWIDDQIIAVASQSAPRHWDAAEYGGDLSRSDSNPIVALLQVASNVM